MRNRLLIGSLVGSVNNGLLAIILLCSGIAFAANDMPEVRFTVDRFVVEGENPLSDHKTKAALTPFLGEHDGLESLEEAAKALEETLKDNGYTFHRVLIPPQKLKDGRVKLNVLAFRLGDVTVEGHSWFSEENVRRSLPLLQKGRSINTRKIARMLQVVNDHPAKKTAVFMRQGEIPETVDTRVQVREGKPYQFFSSFTNTGDPDTGRTRLSLGLQHSNLFDRDHAATVSYTTSPEFVSDVTQVGIHYRIPVYQLSSVVSLFFSHSEVDQGLIADFFDVSGKGDFGGGSIEYTLIPVGVYSHKLSLGFQDRLFENDTAFESTTIGLDVRSRPVNLRYTGRVERAEGIGTFYIDGVVNARSGNNNDNVAYDAVREGAETNWKALRYGADLDMVLPKKWRLRAKLSGQQADQALIPGEQFGIGGVRSVRGFDEREVTGDTGQQISTEVWTPSLPYNLRLVGFLDAGYVRLDTPPPGGTPDEFISGTGIGVRWFWKDKFSLSVDAAVALDGTPETDSGDEKFHFSLFFRY